MQSTNNHSGSAGSGGARRPAISINSPINSVGQHQAIVNPPGLSRQAAETSGLSPRNGANADRASTRQPTRSRADPNMNGNSNIQISRLQTDAFDAQPAARVLNTGQALCEAIDRVYRNMNTLHAVFEEYDVYDGRIFAIWELDEIFQQTLTFEQLKNLCEENQAIEKLTNGTASYKFIFNLILNSPACPTRFKNEELKMNPNSIYATKDHMIQGQLLALVTKLLDEPCFAAGNISKAFDEIFGPHSGGSHMAQQINLELLKKKFGQLFLKDNLSFPENTYSEFIDYVAIYQHVYYFTKVKFVAAMSHLTILHKPELTRYFKEQMPGMAIHSQPKIQQQNTFNSAQQSAFAQQAAIQTIYTDPGHPQPGYQHQNSGFNPAPSMQHQPTMAGNQKLPPNIKVLVNRICENLNNQGKTVEDAFRGVPVENISGVAASRTRDFTSHCEKIFQMNSSEAFSVAAYFFINRPKKDHVDFLAFTTLINFEISKFEAVLKSYDLELRALRTSLGQRHAGVHKWFQSYVKNTNMADNTLEFAEFSKAIKDFNCFQVTDLAIQGIFNGLDQTRVGQVLVADVESMFKIHQRKANSNVRTDEVIASILRAFNCDLQYICDELQAISQQNSNVLSLEDATRLFQRFPGYQGFYQDEELSVVLDTFVKDGGRIDLPELYETMQRVLRYNNPQLLPNPNSQGIHKKGGVGAFAGGESWSPLKSFSTFSVDATSALARAPQIVRPQTLPDIDDRKIEDLQKACFVRGRTILQYFEETKGATRDGNLSKTVFHNTILDLQLGWSSMDVDKFFQQICETQGNGRFDEVSANTVDEVVHFLCKKTLVQMHAELIYQIFQKSTSGRMPPLQQVFEDHLQRAGGGYYQQSFSKTCTLNQLEEVLRNYQVLLNRIDLTYLASQYIVSGRQEDIHYQKLIDDVKNAQRAAAGMNFSQADPKSICTSIIKQMHIFDLQLQQYLSNNAGRGGFFTEAEFLNLMGASLQLCPEVCSEQQLRNLYSQVDQRSTNSVSQQVLVQYIQSNTKSVENLKIELQKHLADQDIDRRFMNHHSFIQDGVNFPIPEFISILKQLFVTTIDAKFLVKFYQDYRQQFVNAHNFVQETMRQKIGPGQIEVLTTSTQLKGMSQANEKEAREALRQISNMSEALRIQFQSKIGRMMKGNQTSYINTAEIKRNLTEFMPSLPQHLEMALLLKYMKPEDNNQFNFQLFQSDLQQIVGLNDSKISTLDEPTRRLFALVKQYLTDGEVQVRFVINLKTFDSLEHGYLNEAMILQAFENTYLDMKPGSRVPRLSPQEFQKLLRPISRNANGFYNYREILVQIFGLEQGDKYFLMDRQQLETETGTALGSRSNRYVLPQQVVNPKNNSLAGIGTKIIQANGNIEETIKQVLGVRTDNKMTFDQIMTVLQQLRVNLTPDERNLLMQWSRQSQDAQALVSALQFLNDIGLPPQTLIARDKKKPPVKELRNEELVEAQKLINMISEELRSQNKRPEDVIEKHRMSRTELGMKPPAFMKALQAEVPRLMQRLDKSKVSLLVHYLVQEECGQVSFNKLQRALNLTVRDPPLKQDQIEQIREHKQVIERTLSMATCPIEVAHLLHFMSQNSLSIPTMFKIVSQSQLTQASVIEQRTFDECCSENRYEPKDRDRLIQALSDRGPRGASSISLFKLQGFKKEWDKKNQGARGPGQTNAQNYGRFDQTVKVKLEKISQWMQANSYTTAQLYDMLDGNKDGNVDKQEFVQGLTSLRIPGFIQKDYVTIFEAIDTDNNLYLSLNEFGLFLEGIKKSREQRLNELPQEIIRDIQNQIRDLFNVFDADNSGTVDRSELMKTLQGLGYEIDHEKADAMIKKVDTSGKGQITIQEFTTLMMPEMQQRLLEQDDRIEDFRAIFKDADTDYSGYLTVDEVYTVLLKKGIDLTHDELCELIAEFDVSGDGQLDIDEFVAMMNISSDMVFSSSNAKNTYLKIRQSSRLNVVDFMKAFKTLPSAFIPSVFTNKWIKESKVRPSEVLKAQLDPRTMTWKDMLPVLSEELTLEMQQPANRPKIRPIQTQYGCEIQLESAEGIPLPTNSSEFDRNMIVKRAVRIGMFDSKKSDFIANAVQVEATWQASAEDKWVFPKTNVSLNPVLFRSTKKDDLALDGISLIFEFVIYYKKGNQNLELSSGWAKTDDLNVANRNLSNFKLKIQGGSPTTSILIEESDVNTKRTGIAGLLKAFSSKITTHLTVSFKPHTQLEPETKFHMQFLPSTCLIQKRILLFVSGYRNYAGQSLLKESSLGNFKQPGGNACLASFPKIIDNIDILETVAAVWSEDVMAALSAPQKKSIEHPMMKAKEIIYKIYPVLFAEEFSLNESNYMISACFDQNRYQMRVELLLAALRFGGPPKGGKPAPKKPIEELSTFKPFNVRETMWEVWDVKEGKYEQYLNLHQQRGMFADSAVINQKQNSSDAAPGGFMPRVQSRDRNIVPGEVQAAMTDPNSGPSNPNANIALRPRNPGPSRRNM